MAAIDHDTDVGFGGDFHGLGHEDFLDVQALDVHAEDRLGVRLASAALRASLTPPALPRPPTCTCALTTTGLPILGDVPRLGDGGGHSSLRNRDASRCEDVLGLILVDFHS